MASFAVHFRQLVLPQLRERIDSAAFCLSRGRWDFSTASGFVLDLARQRGALHLADKDLLALCDWIDGQLLARCEDFNTNQAAGAAFCQETSMP